MSTALFELAASIPDRISELHTLINHAKSNEKETESLYNAICRATSVLLASHLEGFLKELTTALTTDLNYNLGSFGNMPKAMQRNFCERIAYYEGVAKTEIDERVKQLIAFFTKNSVSIDLKAITYKENPNKNASANFIESSLGKFGISGIISVLSGGKFEVVFDNYSRTNYILMRDMRRFRSILYSFPYRPLPNKYKFEFRSGKASRREGTQTLWHMYIEDVLTRRHKVAHGDTLGNETSWEELSQDTVKLEVLMHGLMYASASFLSNQNTE